MNKELDEGDLLSSPFHLPHASFSHILSELAAKGGVNRRSFCQHKASMNSQGIPWQWWRTYPNVETLPLYILRNTSVFLKFSNVNTKVPSKARHGGFRRRYGLRASQLRERQNVLSRKMWKPYQRFGKSQLRHTRISNWLATQASYSVITEVKRHYKKGYKIWL